LVQQEFPDLNDQQVEALTSALGLRSTEDQDLVKRQAEAFRNEAVLEWIRWIGGRRLASSSDLDRERVLTLYGRIRRDSPTVQKLADELGFSETRARTMVSRMRYGSAHVLQELRLTDLAGFLKQHLLVGADPTLAVSIPMSYERSADIKKLLAIRADEVAGTNAPEVSYTDPTRNNYRDAWEFTGTEWSAIVSWLDARAAKEGRLAGNADG
jgi:hypothetical protein